MLKIYPENPHDRAIKQVTEVLSDDGIIIIPTDTVYALACKLGNQKGFERICRILGKKPEKVNFSMLCMNLSNISEYTQPFDNSVYKLMRRNLPGPFTFILNANSNVPRLFKSNKKTIGIRVPDNKIPLCIIEDLGIPLISSSLHSADGISDYLTDPEEIDALYDRQVDLIIDGGAGGLEPSTIIDCTSKNPEVMRQGKGELK